MKIVLVGGSVRVGAGWLFVDADALARLYGLDGALSRLVAIRQDSPGLPADYILAHGSRVVLPSLDPNAVIVLGPRQDGNYAEVARWLVERVQED